MLKTDTIEQPVKKKKGPAKGTVYRSKPGVPKGTINNPNGRPKGVPNKISASKILQAIEDKVGVPFEIALANDYDMVRKSGDLGVLQRFTHMILNKVIADKTEITFNHELQLESMVESLRMSFQDPNIIDIDLTQVNEIPLTQEINNGKEK